MKQTLLQMTQDILSGLSSDEVNSIGDTAESMQVATIIKNKYYDIIDRVSLNEHSQLIQLDPSLTQVEPVIMYIPSGVTEVKWLKYFNTNILNDATGGGHDINVDIIPSGNPGTTAVPGYEYVTILPIQQFIDMVNTFNPSENNIEEFTFHDNSNKYNGVYKFYYRNDKQPQYCTILSNYYVIFDSYDATQDDTLQNSKTMAYGKISPVFLMEDDFTPDLADEQFTLLFNESKALAFYELKQTVHVKAEQEIKRGWSSVQKTKSIIDRPTYFDQLPDFSRRGGSRGPVSFFKSQGWDRP